MFNAYHLTMWEKITGDNVPSKIYCRNCSRFHKKEELRILSGDDSIHFFCPGCDEDLLQPLSLADLKDHHDDR
jgi:hypothetical protein